MREILPSRGAGARRGEGAHRAGRAVIASRGVMRGMMAAWLLAMASVAGAEATITLPAGGAYRAGHYMAVEISGAAGDEDVVIEGEGVLPTRLLPTGGGDARIVVPVLAIGPQVHGLRVRGGAQYAGTLRPLTIGQTLVASHPEPPDGWIAAVGLEDTARPLRAPIEALLAAPHPAEAWTGLDAVVLEPAEYAALPGRTIDVLTAAGCVIAVHAQEPPDEQNWVTRGSWQVLPRRVLGPRRAVIDEAAYAPMQAWLPGWSGGMRRHLWLAGLAVGVISFMASLGRRRPVIGVLIVALVSGAGVTAWQLLTPPVFDIIGSVTVEPHAANRSDPVPSQRDTWAYQTAARPGRSGYRVRGITWPALASRTHADRLAMELRCAPDGGPQAWTYDLPAGGTAAFLSRTWELPDQPDADPSPATAMDALVHRLYRGDGTLKHQRFAASGLGHVHLTRQQ